MGTKIFLGKPPAHIESWIKNHTNNSGCGDSGCGCGNRLKMTVSLSDSLYNTIDDKQIEIIADNGEQSLVLNRSIKSGQLWTDNLHAHVRNGYVMTDGGGEHWDTGFGGSNIVITAFKPFTDSGCGCGCS